MKNQLIEKKMPELQGKIDPNKPLNSQLKEYVNAMAMEKALTDERLKTEITEKKRQELLNNADAQLKTEKAESKKADVEIQQAEFGVFEGVAKYAGITHHLPIKMQHIIFTILSIIQGFFIILIGVPVSIANITIEQLNSIVGQLNYVAKSVKRIMITAFIVGAIALVGLIIYKLVV